MVEERLEVLIGKALRQRGWRLATAESCTGGLLGHILTSVPGSSTYYVGGVVSYAYDAKVRLLGVSWDKLEAHGAVSQEVVLEMAGGIREVMGSDVGLSVTGIAGPSGGTPEKPVGLTWIGLSAPDGEWARQMIAQGDRAENKQQAAQQALQMLHDYLQNQLS
jgi:PncC family amidohydrolase